MQSVFRVSMLLWVAALLASPLAAGPAEDLADVAKYFPAGTEGFLYFKSPAEVKGLFRGSILVSGDRVERHLEDALGKFAAATGFHPIKNSEWAVINLVFAQSGKAQTPLAFIKGAFNPAKLLPAVEKDPLLTSGEVTKEMVAGRPLYVSKTGNGAGFPTDTLLIMGDAALVRACLQAKPAKAVFDVTPAVQAADPTAHGILMSLDLSELASRIPPNAGNPAVAALLSKMERLTIAFGEKDLAISITFHQPQEAATATQMLSGLKDFGKSYFTMMQSRVAMADPAAVLTRVSPESLYSTVMSEAMSEFLAAVTIGATDRVMAIKAPRDRIPFIDQGNGTIAVLLASGAVAIPTFLKGRDIAAKTACYQNQRILQAGIEHYKSKNKNAKIDLDKAVDALVTEGVITGKPDDPGEGKGTFGNYSLLPDGNITCSKHGSHTESPGSPGLIPGGGMLTLPSAPAVPAAPEAPATPAAPVAPATPATPTGASTPPPLAPAAPAAADEEEDEEEDQDAAPASAPATAPAKP